MDNTMKTALAVGIGYMLGRKRKMRLALMIATGAATGGFGGAASRMLRSGGKRLASADALGKLSPELGHVTDAVKGDLVDAGKAAARAAINNRIESISGSLHSRTQALLEAGQAAGRDQDADDLDSEDQDVEGTDAEDQDAEDQDAEDQDAEDQDTADRVQPRRTPRERPPGDGGGKRRPDDARPRSGRSARPAERDRSADRDRPAGKRTSAPRARRPASGRQDRGD
jgi:hypothetical protein